MKLSEMLILLRDSEFRLKGIQKTTGLEGRGWHTKVYRNGKKVGIAYDSANGGPIFIQVDEESLARLEELGAALHYKPKFEKAGCYLSELVKAYDLRSRILKRAKSRVFVQHLQTGSCSMIEFSIVPTPDAIASVRRELEKEGHQNIVILNELLAEIEL